MRIEHLKYLVCPACKSDLVLTEKELASNDRVGKGILECSSCSEKYPIIRDIPRFVPLVNYASGFGFEWNKHARTQYDSYSGANVSETRFFKETKWSRQLQGRSSLRSEVVRVGLPSKLLRRARWFSLGIIATPLKRTSLQMATKRMSLSCRATYTVCRSRLTSLIRCCVLASSNTRLTLKNPSWLFRLT